MRSSQHLDSGLGALGLDDEGEGWGKDVGRMWLKSNPQDADFKTLVDIYV
jgi:hypothetical protein